MSKDWTPQETIMAENYLNETRGKTMMQFTNNRTYVGRTYRNVKEIKSVIITRRTPKYAYYEVDNGTTGRAQVHTDINGEYIMITKENSLYVSAANFMD